MLLLIQHFMIAYRLHSQEYVPVRFLWFMSFIKPKLLQPSVFASILIFYQSYIT